MVLTEKQNMCCPVETVCHPSPFTFSNVYCCNATSSTATCAVTPSNLPTCPPSTFACSQSTGGGCCPTGLICTPNGCLEIHGPSTISVAPSSSAGTPTEQSTVTIIESPASTATLAKEAEVAQEQEGAGAKDSVVFTLWNPYFSVWLLVCVAGVMGML